MISRLDMINEVIITKTDVCKRIGIEVTDEQWETAVDRARNKLGYIISREGDLGGERLKPEYFEKLIAECINEILFSDYAYAVTTAFQS